MNAPFRPDADTAELDVAIIGAGFSGLGMAIALKKAGRTNFRVFEKEADLGGTWWLNRYPGCACDVPSHLYSFSFAQNPDWSRSYSPQAEIWRYLKAVAARYDLAPFMRFNAAVDRAEWDEARQFWRVTLKTGETVTARALVSGTGALHVPSYPKIKGLETFKGKVMHSAEWDESYDLSGKRVAVIGTGASAIQIVPAIAEKVAHLDLFQRTPAWVLPRMDGDFSQKIKDRFRRFPLLQRLFRTLIYSRMEMGAIAFTLRPSMMKNFEGLARKYLATAVPDPALREKLTPTYTIGCKRALVSDDFYPSMNRPNVSLVTDPIREIVANGVVTENGALHEADVLVCATGFRVTDWLANTRIVGRGGRTLVDEWKKAGQASAYYGITVSGFPNFFMLLGPNTGLGHNSVVFMIEAQLRYATDCMRWLWSGKTAAIEPRLDVQKSFMDALNAKMKGTVWMSGCKSWYLNENGTNSAIWPSFTLSYWWRTHSARKRDFILEPARKPATIAA
jgi:cation diffusion facilitator CzcD-associated flavoprotein CzcO